MDKPDNSKSPSRDAYVAILIARPGAGMDAVQAVDLTGGRLVARIDWAAVPDELSRIAVQPVILIETAGVEDAVLSGMLPRIDGYATALDLAIVVALDVAQIDVVSAGLLGSNAEMLCAPTTALRWIARMTEAGLFERVPDPADRRRAFMRLAPRASEAMHGYFAARARQEAPVR